MKKYLSATKENLTKASHSIFTKALNVLFINFRLADALDRLDGIRVEERTFYSTVITPSVRLEYPHDSRDVHNYIQ